jgi:Calcium-activated chloride channel
MENGYVELCLQYGFVIMFSLACPVVPVLSVLSCWALLSDKKLQLYQAQRPTPSAKSTIGPWLTFCEVNKQAPSDHKQAHANHHLDLDSQCS